jgi:hypothetical protein
VRVALARRGGAGELSEADRPQAGGRGQTSGRQRRQAVPPGDGNANSSRRTSPRKAPAGSCAPDCWCPPPDLESGDPRVRERTVRARRTASTRCPVRGQALSARVQVVSSSCVPSLSRRSGTVSGDVAGTGPHLSDGHLAQFFPPQYQAVPATAGDQQPAPCASPVRRGCWLIRAPVIGCREGALRDAHRREGAPRDIRPPPEFANSQWCLPRRPCRAEMEAGAFVRGHLVVLGVLAIFESAL